MRPPPPTSGCTRRRHPVLSCATPCTRRWPRRPLLRRRSLHDALPVSAMAGRPGRQGARRVITDPTTPELGKGALGQVDGHVTRTRARRGCPKSPRKWFFFFFTTPPPPETPCLPPRSPVRI